MKIVTISAKCSKQINELIAESDKDSDILLLSDSIVVQRGHSSNAQEVCPRPIDDLIQQLYTTLYAAEKHAIVCGQEIENDKSLIETANKYLPEYTITIQANTNCVLLKRSVFDTFGPLDTAYNSLQYALMDYYCRINRFGFSAVVSHQALYSHNDTSEAPATDNTGNSKDAELFKSRYDYWEEKEKRFNRHGIDPCVGFLHYINTDYISKKKILFDCVIMPAMHCGTSEYQISVFDAFYRAYKNKYDIFLYTNHEADEYHKLSEKYGNILYPETLTGKFHLGFAPNQLMFYEPMLTLDRHCLKVVQTMYDVMMVRIDEHVVDDVSNNVEAGIKLSDGIVFISSFTKNDFKACFKNNKDLANKKLKVIYPATGFSTPKKEYELPFEKYFLIIGNSYKHKAIAETIDVVSVTPNNYIVVGYGDNDLIHPNVYGYKSGNLDEDFLSFLYTGCEAVIFPSMYEGFGLPVVVSLKNKKRIILNNNELSRELTNHFNEFKDYFHLFGSFEEINEIINKTDFSLELQPIEYTDTWDRVASELDTFFEEILASETNADTLHERRSFFNLVESNLINAQPLIKTLKEENHKQHEHIMNLTQEYRSITGSKKLSFLFPFALKTYIRNRFPGLYKQIKGKV